MGELYQKIEESSDEDIYDCTQCVVSFISKTDISRHFLNFHGSPQKRRGPISIDKNSDKSKQSDLLNKRKNSDEDLVQKTNDLRASLGLSPWKRDHSKQEVNKSYCKKRKVDDDLV